VGHKALATCVSNAFCREVVTYNFAIDVATVESPQKPAALAFDHRDFRNDVAGKTKAEVSFVEGARSRTTLCVLGCFKGRL
jgi:hypothetical protein